MKRSAVLLSIQFVLLAAFVISADLAVQAQKPKDIRASQARLEQGNRAFNQRNFKEAIEKYAEAIALNPRNTAAHYWKGRAHSFQEEHELALMELGTALEQGYQKPLDIYLLRWRIYYAEKDYAAAQKDVDAALSIDPENFDLLVAQGDMNFVNKRYPEALDAYQRAVAKQPNNAELYLNIAKIHYFTGNPQGQGDAAQEAINKRTMSLGEAYLLLGDALRTQRRFPEATTALQSALSANPNSLDTYESLAEVYRAQNKYDDAITTLRRALPVFDDDGRIYTNLAWYYSLANRHEEAADAAKAGIKLSPNEYLAYTNLCRAYNDLKRPEMAIRECNNALRLQPDDGETLYYLGRASELMNKSDEAARYYRRAVPGLEKATKTSPGNSDYFYLLGNAYYSDNHVKKAIAAYVRSLELTPAFARARFNLGLAYVADNNKSAAMQQYNALAPLDGALAALLKTEIDAMR